MESVADLEPFIPHFVASRTTKPWGAFITHKTPCCVKELHINAGAKLSLQSHLHRDEVWLVLDGTVDVVVNDKITRYTAGESVHIPIGAKHRAIGLKESCCLLEFSYGIFDENDIKRYEDEYDRI